MTQTNSGGCSTTKSGNRSTRGRQPTRRIPPSSSNGASKQSAFRKPTQTWIWALGPDTPPGEGVIVGVLDTGIDTVHFAFEGKHVFELFLPGAIDEDGSEVSHGTAVAGLIAGVDDPDFGFDAPGVAWGADLVVFALPLGTAPELYNPIMLDDLPGTSEYFAQTVNEILSWSHEGRSIDFLNLSLGVSGVIDNFSEAQLREHFSAATAAFAQAGADEKVVFVWAAGNAHGTPCDVAVVECVDGAVDAVSPGLLAGLAARLPELRGHTVSVVAIGQDGEIHRLLQPLRHSGPPLPCGPGR